MDLKFQLHSMNKSLRAAYNTAPIVNNTGGVHFKIC